jgi:hypothetical protein
LPPKIHKLPEIMIFLLTSCATARAFHSLSLSHTHTHTRLTRTLPPQSNPPPPGRCPRPALPPPTPGPPLPGPCIASPAAATRWPPVYAQPALDVVGRRPARLPWPLLRPAPDAAGLPWPPPSSSTVSTSAGPHHRP